MGEIRVDVFKEAYEIVHHHPFKYGPLIHPF